MSKSDFKRIGNSALFPYDEKHLMNFLNGGAEHTATLQTHILGVEISLTYRAFGGLTASFKVLIW